MLQTMFELIAEPITLPQCLDKLDPKTSQMHVFMRGVGERREDESMMFENGSTSRVFPKIERVDRVMLERWLEGWEMRVWGEGSML